MQERFATLAGIAIVPALCLPAPQVSRQDDRDTPQR